MVASCWFFQWDLYYYVRIHEHQGKIQDFTGQKHCCPFKDHRLILCLETVFMYILTIMTEHDYNCVGKKIQV